MNNTMAIVLGGILTVLIGIDQILNQGVGTIFLGRKFLEFVSYIAFWH